VKRKGRARACFFNASELHLLVHAGNFRLRPPGKKFNINHRASSQDRKSIF
jgi:hypothetical protein